MILAGAEERNIRMYSGGGVCNTYTAADPTVPLFFQNCRHFCRVYTVDII